MISATISIVVPNYNNTIYLQELISCIIKQTYREWELIIIDDCSTDGSFEFAKKFEAVDSRIKVIKRNISPKGGQTCRNIGKSIAQGEYIVFFDSDDLVPEYCLEQRITFMNQNPNIDFAVFKAHSFKPGQNPFKLSRRDVVWGSKPIKDAINLFLKNDYPFTVWTNIYRAKSLLGLSWDEKILVRQDLDFNLSALFSGLKYTIDINSRYDYFYRGAISENNVSRNMLSNEKYESMLYLFDKILSRIQETSKAKTYTNSLKRYIVHYYTQLLIAGDPSLINRYINHFRNNYSNGFIYKLSICYSCTMHFKNKAIREIVAHVVGLILFGYKYYYYALYKKILKMFYPSS